LAFTITPPINVKFSFGIDPLPFNIPFEVSRTGGCLTSSPTFTVTGSSLVLTADLTATGGKIQLAAATIADVGTYSLVLKA
jgi:hypothetical protein